MEHSEGVRLKPVSLLVRPVAPKGCGASRFPLETGLSPRRVVPPGGRCGDQHQLAFVSEEKEPGWQRFVAAPAAASEPRRSEVSIIT